MPPPRRARPRWCAWLLSGPCPLCRAFWRRCPGAPCRVACGGEALPAAAAGRVHRRAGRP
eukprot:2864046-Pleurochrysis_carterae.AAC.2